MTAATRSQIPRSGMHVKEGSGKIVEVDAWEDLNEHPGVVSPEHQNLSELMVAAAHISLVVTTTFVSRP